jgi:hypothetical protein
MVVTVAFGVVTAVLLLPIVAGAAGTWWLARPAFGPYAVFPAGLVGLAAILLEAWLAAGWLGRVFERTDPAALESVGVE